MHIETSLRPLQQAIDDVASEMACIMCIYRLVMDSSELRDAGTGMSGLPASHRPVQWSPPTRWRSPLLGLAGRSREAGRSLECMKASPGGKSSKAWRREMRGCRDKNWADGGAKKGECKVNGFTAAVIISLDENGLVQSWWDAGKLFEAGFRLRCSQMCLFLFIYSEMFLYRTWKRQVYRQKYWVWIIIEESVVISVRKDRIYRIFPLTQAK